MTTRWTTLLAIGALALILGRADAVPTVRGATGMIRIPTAQLAQSTGLFFRDGKIATGGTQNFTFMEGGILNRLGKTQYDAKLQLLPDITNEAEWVPGVAVGVRGVGRTEEREWYGVVSKHFTFPEFHAAIGASRQVSFSRGKTNWFYGVEVPLFFGLSVLGDHDGHTDVTSAGVRWIFLKRFCVYDYVEDVRRKEDRWKRNIIGACYQSHF